MIYPILRILIGVLFLVSGIEKAVNPYQNFAYAISGYQILPDWGRDLSAQIFPWVEILAGLFLVLGLWTRGMLMCAMAMFALFICIVSQALLRGLSMEECGCFGQLVHIPPRIVVLMDSFFLLLTFWLLRKEPLTRTFGLDALLSDSKK